MTRGQALASATARLVTYSDSPRLDAEVLLAFIAKTSRTQLTIHPEKPLTAQQRQHFLRLIQRRQAGLPVAYLTGTSEFCGHLFQVSQSVLVPRPFTELLVEHVAQIIENHDVVVDCGTGSGAIAVSLALARPNTTLIATDVSSAALSVARRNARRLKASSTITFRRGSLLTPLRPNDRPTIIVANLPYLTPRQMCEPSIRREPALALAGGEKGMKLMRQLIRELPRYPTIRAIALECDPSQIAQVRRLLKTWQPRLSVGLIRDGRATRGLLAIHKPRAT